MKYAPKFYLFLFVLVVLGSACKRCYQCVVRDTADDDLQWGYKEICVTKKDYEEYVTICEDAALAASDSIDLYCDCGENLVVE